MIPRGKLPCPALLAVLLWLTLTGPAHAHRLDAEYEVLPNPEVKSPAGSRLAMAPKIARVTVRRANGDLLFPEPLEMKDGELEFSFGQIESLRVEISAGKGTARCWRFLPKTWRRSASGRSRLLPAQPEPTLASAGPDVLALLAGVGLLLGLAALVISLGNARAIRQLRGQLRTAEIPKSAPGVGDRD